MKTELEILNYHLTKDSLGVNLTQNDRIIHAMREYAEQLRQPPVIGSVCDHPNRQREYYHDGAYKCWKCHKIIVAN